mmetsp:Transcript_12396/g.46257  ORF Transcript_12396/g.46257 Transcript_12396/m.46257 type:complete len:642 (-) Transcript_12396:152-2077(-)
MAPAANELCKLLDADETLPGVAFGGSDVDHERYERAESARAQAESDAAEGKRRLEVARTQFAEYATSKADESRALRDAISRLASVHAGSDVVTDALAQLDLLAKQAETEARAMAANAEAEALTKTEARLLNGDDSTTAVNGDGDANDANDVDMADPSIGPVEADIAPSSLNMSADSFTDRAKYIPLRLDMEERKLLRLLEASLHVSEYTDRVDVITFRGKTQRITQQLKEICAIMCGLVVATDYRKGQALIRDKEFEENAEFFQAVFEIGRRHKIMNPEKMRSEYGKMVYLLQDSQTDEVTELLGFKLVKPLRTAYTLLAKKGGLDMLRDPLMETATAEIAHAQKQRFLVQKEIRAKEKAREFLARRYATDELPSEDILRVLYSISDNNAYLRFNRDPVSKMLAYLTEFFDAKTPESREFSLGISVGSDGARLSHTHERQFLYVSQSLTLWREVSNDMFKLWTLAEGDLLRQDNRYSLTNTGQGLNRVQSAPNVGKAMHAVLHKCQKSLGGWVGSSVVHLGDHNVPNALMFIDKYTQVPRILGPTALVVDSLEELCKDAGLNTYVCSTFGSVENCRKTILVDFFRHAFDGSGADNFFDAGSCIDGRLTSAWNWCSKIEKKPYYPVFKLAGFAGFDGGDFRS